jgi:predicted NBD/HSP70 family sugar kinase
MQHYVGLDVSVNETSVCIVDKAGKVIREDVRAYQPVGAVSAGAIIKLFQLSDGCKEWSVQIPK